MNKKVLAIAVSSALAAPMAAHAVKYKLSGQINRAAVYNNDGENSDVQFVDNISSGTRWRLTGSEDIGNGMKVGFNWEWQNSSNPSSTGAGIHSGDSSGTSETMRKAEVWFSGGWGKVSLGQGDGAGNGTTEVDLSDTWNVAYTGRSSFGANVAFRCNSAAAGVGCVTPAGATLGTLAAPDLVFALDPDDGTVGTSVSSVTHGSTFDHWDAFSRYDRIRYDSPALGPVTLATSAGQNNRYEIAGRWSQGIGGGQISAGLFWGTDNGAAIKNRWGGSIAYLFSFGTNLQFAYGENEPDGSNTTKARTWYVKAGHKWGNNAVSVGYGEAKDTSQDLIDFYAPQVAGDGSGWKNKGFNVGFNHNIPKAKVDLYAGFQFVELDTPSGVVSVDDIWTATIGTKLKFD